MQLNIIGKSRVWLTFSGILVGLSIVALIFWGLKPGIDFTGGSLMRIEFLGQKLSNDQIKEVLSSAGGSDKYGQVTIQSIGNKEAILKFKAVSEDIHQEMLEKIKIKTNEVVADGKTSSDELVREIKFDSIGPSVGKELREKSSLAVIIVLLAIIGYVAWAFRSVSNQLNKYESVYYGVAAIIALAHDVIITMGVFAVLGHFGNIEIDTFFIAALLTILGYSVNDTIIIFDRIRENVLRGGNKNFREAVNRSANEVMVRSMSTSSTTLITLFCILLFGGQTTFYFVLALIIGIILGTYSSIFLASPLLVWWKERRSSRQ